MKKRQEEEWESRLGTKSFNPLEAMELQDAVLEYKQYVTFQTGRSFLLSYYERIGLTGLREEMVYFKPERGFVPCGHLNRNRLLRGI